MNKTKLLMPLIGLTSLSAVAPVIALTSCTKSKTVSTIISDSEIGTVYDSHRLLVTNRFGYESTKGTYAPFQLKNHLTKPFADGHKMTITIPAQGGDADAFSIEMDETDLKVETNAIYAVSDVIGDALKVNSSVISILIQTKEEQAFKFNVVYKEYNADNKVTATQTIKYTLVACPALHDLPSIETMAIDSTTTTVKTGQTNVTMTGVAFSQALTSALNCAFKSIHGVTLSGHDDYMLTFNQIQNPEIAIGEKNITINGSLNMAAGAAGTKIDFNNFSNLYLEVVLADKNNEQYYILKQWNASIILTHPAGDTWSVTVTA